MLEDINELAELTDSLREFKERCIALGNSPDDEPDCPLRKVPCGTCGKDLGTCGKCPAVFAIA
jgi:hypothetical protein